MLEYIVTLDWYDENSGHNIEVYPSTTDEELALSRFQRCVADMRMIDEDAGYTVMDDTEHLYYAHGTMPNYTRVQIHTAERK